MRWDMEPPGGCRRHRSSRFGGSASVSLAAGPRFGCDGFPPGAPHGMVRQTASRRAPALGGRRTKWWEDDMRLQGKTALVTGAASGFGEGIAKTFAAEGAKVVLMDVNAEGLRRVAGDIGPAAVAVQADVTSAADTGRAVRAALDFGGRLDIVVNNAGWSHRNKPVLEVTEE